MLDLSLQKKLWSYRIQKVIRVLLWVTGQYIEHDIILAILCSSESAMYPQEKVDRFSEPRLETRSDGRLGYWYHSNRDSP